MERVFARMIWGIGICVWLCGPAVVRAGENLVPNPAIERVIRTEDARKTIPEELHHQRIQQWNLRPADIIPEDWRPYNGGGRGLWGATDEEAFVGEYSAFVSSGGLMEWQGEMLSTLYLYSTPFEIEGDATYDFTFMIKGDVPIVRVYGFLWPDEEKTRDGRSFARLADLRRNDAPLRGHLQTGGALRVSPSPDEWSRYSMTLGTRQDSRVLQLAIGFTHSDQEIEKDQTIYVDDVRIIKRD